MDVRVIRRARVSQNSQVEIMIAGEKRREKHDTRSLADSYITRNGIIEYRAKKIAAQRFQVANARDLLKCNEYDRIPGISCSTQTWTRDISRSRDERREGS